MLRALWTGASGMTAQQVSLDNIANNLSNVNTAGYKKQSAEFSTLLYQKLQREVTDHNGDPKPVIGQVGSGVRVAGLTTIFTQGILSETGNDFDMAISGNGFFRIGLPDGTIGYTRNGAFQTAYNGNGVTLATAEGYPVLGTDGEPISIDAAYDVSHVVVDEDGNLFYQNPQTDETLDMNMRIGLVQFNNPAGLEKISGTLMRATDNSGAPRLEAEDTALKKSDIITGYLEGSNVQTVDEMVNLIVTQRAYEMNSKVITASDEMMQQANNLRG